MRGAVADARRAGGGGGGGAADGGQSLGEVPVERRSDDVDGESDRHDGHHCLQHHWNTAMVMNGHLRFDVTHFGGEIKTVGSGSVFFVVEIEVKIRKEDKRRVQCQRQTQRERERE